MDLSSSEAEDAETLSFSLTVEGELARSKAPSNEALDNSLSSFASLSSLAESKGSSKRDGNNSFSPIEDEDGSSLSDCSEEVTSPRSLSPSQFVGSLMKRSGSKEKLLVQAATAPPENLGSASLSLSPTLPFLQDQAIAKEKEADDEVDLWVKNAMRLGPSSTSEAEKSTVSPRRGPAGSSSSFSSISVNKQATPRQVAAELLFRRGDLSLSAPFHSASGTQDNLLLSQVDSGSVGKQQYPPEFTEEQRARFQNSRAERDERVARLKAKVSSASSDCAHIG